jgi:hypothetical protein
MCYLVLDDWIEWYTRKKASRAYRPTLHAAALLSDHELTKLHLKHSLARTADKVEAVSSLRLVIFGAFS